MPIESLEVAALRNLARDIGAVVTATNVNDGSHSATSYHYAQGTNGTGLAVDLAGQTSGRDTPELQAIATAVATRIGGQCMELIYAHGPCYKNRVKVDCLQMYGARVISNHRNHVHVAVPRGFRYTAAAPVPPAPKVRPMYDPPLILAPVVAALAAPGGGAWVLTEAGAIYAFAGAPDLGAPNRHSYWGDRRAAQLEPLVRGYTVVADTGERYDYPAT